MRTQRDREGYILIDHRDAPGVAPTTNSGRIDTPFVGAGATYESATYTCSHCHRVVIIEPLRTRERAYCQKCDHRICDWCAKVPECIPMNAKLDAMMNAAIYEEQRNKSTIPAPSIILTDPDKL